MKRLLLLVLISGAIQTAFAQVPGTLSYQGILIDQATGNPVPNGSHNIKFNFYSVPTGGSPTIFRQVNFVQTYKGMFTCVIGNTLNGLGVDASGDNNALPASTFSGPTYIGVVPIDIAPGAELSPRIALTSVPYAQIASTMDAGGITGTIANTLLDTDLQDLADGSLSGSKVGTGISASNITAGTLTGSLVGTGVSASNITTGTLSGALVGTGINAANITTGTITSAQITDGTIVAGDLANLAVTTAKMATSGVVANTYGSATNIPVITVDVSGRITGVTNTPLSAGTVTTVTAGAPLSVLNGTTTPALSISKATATTDGYLTTSDWNTFNAKQAALTAGNGLTLATNNLTLGGTLTANTIITNGGFSINVAGAGGFGIGAPTPLSKLDVGGSASIGNGYAGVIAAPVNGLIVQGNVGIGNNAPAQRLDVTGNINFTGALMANALPGTSGQHLTSAGAGVAPTWTSPPFVDNGTVISNSPLTRNVSIGSAAATFPFEINRSVGATTAKFGASFPVCFVSNSPMVGFNMAHNSGYQLQSAGAGGMISFNQEMTNGFSFNTAPSGAALSFPVTVSSRMVISNTGNVGIGTTTPSTAGLLHIAGSDIAIDGTLYKGMVWVSGNTMQAHMHRYGSGNSALYVTNAGGSDLTGVYLASGATSWTSTSDRRLKENIRETSYGLNAVLRLPVKEFNFKTSKEKNVIGFIAQEVYPIIPELVEKGDDGEYNGNGSASSTNSTFRPWGVDYGGLTPVLVKAIQEQQKQIEELKATVTQLKAQASQYEGLSAQVEELKKLVLNKASESPSDSKSTITGSKK